MYKAIDLALQGGGSHGAFTWGVLERLLEARSVVIEGICGTSAGAMNATMVAYGLIVGGRQGAINMLETFWKKASEKQKYSPFRPSWFDRWLGTGKLDYSPFHRFFDFYTNIFSPYEFNPLDYNPLRDIVEEMVDFEVLQKTELVKLFICATNVRTGRSKVFTNKEITLDAVMASACLPYVFKAVEIDGEAYWDGGFMGNPPLFPLVDDTETEDILLVQVNPIHIQDIPKTSSKIADRVNDLSFNTSLMHEMRHIRFIQKNLEKGLNSHPNLRNLYIHNIAPPNEEFERLGASSKMNTNWEFIQKLRNYGREQTDEWLQENYDKIGFESTCDIEKTFL